MQLSKENSDAGGCNRSERPVRPPSARPGAPRRGLSPSTRFWPGTVRGPGRLQPSPRSTEESRAQRGPQQAPGTRHPPAAKRGPHPPGARSPALSSGIRSGLRAQCPDSHDAAPSRGVQNTRHRGARPRSAPPFPAPGPCPLGEEGARSYLAEVCGCHPGLARASLSPPSFPPRAPAGGF